MTEILINVDFGHPVERVWQALTDRRLLSAWFMRTDLQPRAGSRFRLVPDQHLGLTGPVHGEVVEIDEHRMVMLWRGEQMYARVTWELQPIPGGCRLMMRQTGFVGRRGIRRRSQLRRAYGVLLGRRLPDLLTQVAEGWVSANDLVDTGGPIRPVFAPPAALSPMSENLYTEPGTHGGAEPPEQDRAFLGISPHRRGQVLAVLGTAALAVLTASVLSLAGGDGVAEPGIAAPGYSEPGQEALPEISTPPAPLPAGTIGQGGAGGPAGMPAAPSAAHGGRSTGRPAVRPSATVPPARDGATAPQPGGHQAGTASWAATYQTIKVTPNGYRSAVVIRNTGTAPGSTWRIVIGIPAGAAVTVVKGASVSQGGGLATFTSSDGATVAVGTSLTIKFRVRDASGATEPLTCQANGASCAGL